MRLYTSLDIIVVLVSCLLLVSKLCGATSGWISSKEAIPLAMTTSAQLRRQSEPINNRADGEGAVADPRKRQNREGKSLTIDRNHYSNPCANVQMSAKEVTACRG
jgi:hypothetical protein